MSESPSTTHRAHLHDVLGIILNSDCQSAQAPMDAYSLIFVMLKDKGPLRDYADVYDFVRESLVEHMYTKSQKSFDLIQATCSYLRRHFIERTSAEDIAVFARRTFLEAKHEKVLANPRWLAEWLSDAIRGVENGSEITDETKKAGRLFLEAYAQHQDDYVTTFADPFIRAAVAHYHKNAKEFLAEDDQAAYQEKKQEILRLEESRGEVYLHDSQRRDYLETLGELFDLGDERFQRS